MIAEILGVFTRYEIAATWAVVGHLLLDQCAANGGRPHVDIVRPSYSWLDGDWYDIDPCSTLAEAPAFYGRDIVAAIAGCGVAQEIGCHSFSHLIVADPGCGEEAFASDLAACRAAAAGAQIELRSFVFPRNAIDHVGLLGEHGFRCYRGPAETAPMGRLARTVDRVRPLARSAVRPVREPERGLEPAPDVPVRSGDERAAGADRDLGSPRRGPPPAGGAATVAVPSLVPPLQRHRGARTGAARAGRDLSGGRRGSATPAGWTCSPWARSRPASTETSRPRRRARRRAADGR